MEGFQSLTTFLLCMMASTITRVSCNAATLASVLPQKTDQFHFQMEMTDTKRNSSTQMMEYYDGKKQLGLMDLLGNEETLIYYNLVNKEIRTVSPSIGKCVVSRLTKALQFNALPRPNTHVISGVAALLFRPSAFTEKYIGLKQVRGIWCNHWKTTMTDSDTYFEMDWYFSDSSWSTATEEASVPVRYMVTGSVHKGKYEFKNYYDFFQFRRDFDNLKNVFETIPGIPCYNQLEKKKMPIIPNVFSSYLEYYDEELQVLVSVKENFDRNNALSMTTYSDPVTNHADKQSNIVINDFNEGVAYNINSEAGECTLTGISHDIADKKNSHHLTMINSEQFFGLRKGNFTYQGIRKVRDIDCDVWVGKVSGKYMSNFVTEIYFSRINELDNGVRRDGQLVGFSAFMSEENHWKPELFFNMFEFSEEEPSFEQFDVSACFKRNMKTLDLMVAEQYKVAVDLNTVQFKLRTTALLIDTMKLSPLRIQNLQIINQMSSYKIQFDLTEPVNFNTGQIKRTSVLEAVKRLFASLKKHDLKVLIGSKYGVTTIPLEVSSNMTIDISKASLSYGKGFMAGLGISMVIVGFFLSLLFVKLRN